MPAFIVDCFYGILVIGFFHGVSIEIPREILVPLFLSLCAEVEGTV